MQFISIHMYVYISLYKYVYIHIYAHIYKHIHIQTYIHKTYKHVCVCVCVYIYIYIYSFNCLELALKGYQPYRICSEPSRICPAPPPQYQPCNEFHYSKLLQIMSLFVHFNYYRCICSFSLL